MDEMIPWNDAATVVQYDASGFEPTILYQGVLREVVERLKNNPGVARSRIRISLPDRGARPYFFDGHALKALLDQVPAPTI